VSDDPRRFDERDPIGHRHTARTIEFDGETLVGPSGADGRDGRDGVDGEHGRHGNDGAQGPEGRQGPAGTAGRDGVDGRDGTHAVLPDGLVRLDALGIPEGTVARAVVRTEEVSFSGGRGTVAFPPGASRVLAVFATLLDTGGANVNPSSQSPHGAIGLLSNVPDGHHLVTYLALVW
jgi:Collagen triple helix repeat (20 copies)